MASIPKNATHCARLLVGAGGRLDNRGHANIQWVKRWETALWWLIAAGWKFLIVSTGMEWFQSGSGDSSSRGDARTLRVVGDPGDKRLGAELVSEVLQEVSLHL